jgi:hypothetical protein
MAAVLAVFPMSVATAQTVMEDQLGSPRAFWDQQENWSGQTERKALRATQQPERWEVLVDLEKDGEWDSQGFLEEVYRRRPEPSVALDEAVKNTIDYFGTVLLIGEVRSATGSRLYVVAAVLEQDSSFQDSEGRALKSFVPLHVNESYQGALRYAQEYEKFFDGSTGNGEPPPLGGPAPRGDSEKAFSCALCDSQHTSNYSSCGTTRGLCVAAATAALAACSLGCRGSLQCEALCVAGYLLWGANCVSAYTSVRSICCLPTVRPVLTVVSGDSGVSTI